MFALLRKMQTRTQVMTASYVVQISDPGSQNVCAVKCPYTEVRLNGTQLTLLADSGSSVNILDESSYHRVGNQNS